MYTNEKEMIDMNNNEGIIKQAQEDDMNFDMEDFLRHQPLVEDTVQSVREPEISKDSIPENSWNQVVNSMENQYEDSFSKTREGDADEIFEKNVESHQSPNQTAAFPQQPSQGAQSPKDGDLALESTNKSKKSAASKMDAVFKVLLRAARNQITSAFKSFEWQGKKLSTGSDHWKPERWISQIQIFIDYCLVEEHGYELDSDNMRHIIQVLLYCRTTMDSRLTKKQRNDKIKEENLFPEKIKKVFDVKMQTAFSEVFRKPAKPRVQKFFAESFNQKLWENFVKTKEYEEKKLEFNPEELQCAIAFLGKIGQSY